MKTIIKGKPKDMAREGQWSTRQPYWCHLTWRGGPGDKCRLSKEDPQGIEDPEHWAGFTSNSARDHLAPGIRSRGPTRRNPGRQSYRSILHWVTWEVGCDEGDLKDSERTRRGVNTDDQLLTMLNTGVKKNTMVLQDMAYMQRKRQWEERPPTLYFSCTHTWDRNHKVNRQAGDKGLY